MGELVGNTARRGGSTGRKRGSGHDEKAKWEISVYTGLGDDELYFIIAGKQLDAVVTRLATIVNANNELESYHQGRLSC